MGKWIELEALPLLAKDQKPDQKTIGQFLVIFSGVNPVISNPRWVTNLQKPAFPSIAF